MSKLRSLFILFFIGIPESLSFSIPLTKLKTNNIASTLVAFSKRSHRISDKEHDDEIVAASSNRASNAASSQRKKKRKKILSSIAYSLLLLVSKPRTSNAVIGYIPKGASGLREQVEPTTPHAPKKIPKEILEKDYGDNNRMKELELKVYEQLTKKKVEKEEERGSGGLRPGRVQGDDDAEAQNKLESIELLLKEIPAASPTPQHKISTITTKKPVTMSKKRTKVVSAIQFSAFISVGALWARAQSVDEAKRVQKGIEIYQSQKAEFFNITTTGEGGDLDDAIKKFNVTLDHDHDHDDDDDEDVVRKPKKQPKKPDSGPSSGPSSGSSGGTPPPKSDMDKPTQEDLERLKRMFDKK